MKKTIALMTAGCMLLLTGCSSYKAGTTDNGIYRNEAIGIQITTPDEYVCYSSDHFSSCNYYITNQLQAKQRGAEKSWVCEYAAKSVGFEFLVCSEENVNGDTLEEFTERIGGQNEVELMGLMLDSVDEVTLGGKRFQRANLSSEYGGTHIYVTEAGNSFVYFFHVGIEHEWVADQEDSMLSNITAIG